jgi:hypothetical protein
LLATVEGLVGAESSREPTAESLPLRQD